MEIKNILERDRQGEPVSIDDPDYSVIKRIINEAKRLTMRMNMQVLGCDEIRKESGVSIDNVALDLTVNSGGSLAAMVGALGFLTDAPIPYSCGDLITGRNTVEYYLVDTDGDGDYTDADAYDMYDWYVLTSPLTFSAANFFASIVQDTGIATVIGERSGGGTCSVFTLVLPDGTTANISGSRTVLQSPVYEGGVVVGAELVESGIAPDIALERQYFYNDASLVDAIQKGADQ